MAVKKTTKASAKKAAPKKAAVAKKVAAKAAPKAEKVVAKKAAAAPKKAAKKKAAPVKLSDKATDLLKKIGESKDAGYYGGKGESKIIESLQTKKLIKRGKKDKDKGYSYTVSKTGEKHLSTPPPAPPSA
jgi:hypothetical protein